MARARLAEDTTRERDALWSALAAGVDAWWKRARASMSATRKACIEAMIARGANPYERMTDGTSAMSLAKAHWPSRVALLEKTAHRDDAHERS